MRRLFIIGNGFDVAHGNKTAYMFFRKWMLQQLEEYGIRDSALEEAPEIPFSEQMPRGEEVYDRCESMKLLMWLLQYGSSIDDEWNRFEASLHDLDLQMVMDENTMFIEEEDPESERDINPFHPAEDYEIYAGELRGAVAMINDLFEEWISSVVLGHKAIGFGQDIICEGKKEHQRPDDLFLTFNYTETLESLYHVAGNQICHIHGSRTDKNGKLIIGHGNDSKRKFDKKYIGASDILEAAICDLRKNTSGIIREHTEFWSSIKKGDITDIYSFGFSYADVDMPYIEKIVECVGDSQKITWHLNSYNHGEENDRYAERITGAGFRGGFAEY